MLTVGTSQHGFMLRAQAKPKGLACHSTVEASIENREDVREMTIVWFEVEKDWWYGRKKLIGSLVSIPLLMPSDREHLHVDGETRGIMGTE